MKLSSKIVVFSLFLGYSTFALLFSNKQGFWHDEIYTLTFMKGISAYPFEGGTLYNVNDELAIDTYKNLLNEDNFLLNFPLQILHEGHPPLYFGFLKIWSITFGYNELALRSFSVLCGVLFLLVLFNLIRYRTKKENTALILLIFTMFNPFLFYYFTEARMYALAMLFAILTFKYWLSFYNTKRFKSLEFLYFTLSSTALLFTHYYGIFFITTLIFFDIIKNGIKANSLLYAFPFILFSPWILVIRKQLSFHAVHWTDGSFSLYESVYGFANGIVELLFSPVSTSLLIERIITLLLVVTIIKFSSLVYLRKLIIWGAILYFIQIFIFDQFLDHHTIIVPRYYAFILILFLWSLMKVLEYTKKKIIYIIILIFLLVSANSIFDIYNLQRAPKQMYRELASYIDVNKDSNKTLIVIESEGTLVWGIANYISNNFQVVFTKDYKSDNRFSNVIFTVETLDIHFDETLDYNYEDERIINNEQKRLKLIPFVGVNLYE